MYHGFPACLNKFCWYIINYCRLPLTRWCWVNFQCRGVLRIWITVGQGPSALAVGAGGGCWDSFSLICHFSFLSPSFWETARYRLKYCLKGPLSPKQPTNIPLFQCNYCDLILPHEGLAVELFLGADCSSEPYCRRNSRSCIVWAILCLSADNILFFCKTLPRLILDSCGSTLLF